MSSRGLADFAIGAGTGYLGAENQRRDRARQDKVDQQNTALYDVRMRRENGLLDDADRLRVDNTTLRTAAQPIAPVQDGSGGMLKADDMDNRDVGLPENAGRPNGGLSLANFRVGQQSFSGKGEADAAAAKLNTPQASAMRLADAQRKIGDVAGANKTITNESARAADQMLKDIGLGLGQGGWGGFTEALSKSAADQTDYSHVINPATGKVDITQTDRKTGGSRIVGSYDDNDTGKLDAFKITASLVAKKTDVAFAHQADRLKNARADRKPDIEEGYKTGVLDAKGAALDAKAALASAKGAGVPNREERLRYTSLFQDAGRRAGEAQKALTSLQKDPMYSMAKEGSPQYTELQGLREAIKSHQEERTLYQGMLAGSQGEAPAPGAAGLSSVRSPSPATQSARDSDRHFILENELASAQQRLASGDSRAQGDIESLNREISRTPGAKSAVASPRPAAPGLANARPAAPAQTGYSHLWK